ncbi:prepilin-type N-terminal cleavage/methylation domain-containing protein [bacterium]|uniref:Type II secretion system protein GspG C-terminal domain-containing protein n=2 Tax=Katanobacteria TaxID=422282 RepID=A0A2M7X0X7_UNCKA|nr:prepilin-type N-terminal cleavage/methylation domain-containing protein [bacterium]PIP56552.1 MAG: hypothetical protein COX05_02460 [candidate division WWE3 bacterium CG22_combo_CG10-13_8_21_14_all_39_12]PJA39802.1 MAG: hypothetical protein CO179_04405 [candidate division WWE3 bacterium CG_4_9_14_3_um_filter_39_7]
MHSPKGFTLIELLVVIVIIGLLAGIGIASYQGSLERSRIGKAQSDVKELFDAVKRYSVLEGHWPPPNNISTVAVWEDAATGLVPEYLESVPVDPWGTPYFYDGSPVSEPGQWQTSVCSAGPDQTFSSHNVVPNGDDICKYYE